MKKLIKLTDGATGERVQVDFDKVTGIVEMRLYTMLWFGEDTVIVDESLEQIKELVKELKNGKN